MIQPLTVMASRPPLVLFCGALLVASCGGSRKPPEHQDEKLVPEETQQRSGELQGRQDMMHDELGMTPSEQAGQRHHDATRPVENPKYGRDKK